MSDELDFIARLRQLPLHPGARNLEDDAAILALGDQTLVLTHDTMAQGTHFAPDADMADVAWKLVATNLSDLAAKGAQPLGVLLGHTLGRADERFVEGLREALAAFDTPLLGGDTIAAPGARTLGLTAIGRATHLPVPSRSGARPGESIGICGTLGAAMLGFEQPAGDHAAALLRPTPLLAQGIALAPLVSAMMDVSDGLLLDATRLAQASGVTLALDTPSLPVADPARLLECLTWGDDYALLFTCPAETRLPAGCRLIGSVLPRGPHAVLLDDAPPPPDLAPGYRHSAP